MASKAKAEKKENTGLAGAKPERVKKRNEPTFLTSRKTGEGEPDYSRFENYEIVIIERKKIKNAPYNPRRISDAARAKLQANLKTKGLMNPPVWNVLTGNIVSGHQRIDVLDALEGTRDYKLRVAQVELSDADEKEQNVFFNNQEAQGEWDMEKLEAMLKDKTIKIESTGFELGTIFQMFGDSPLIEQPERLSKLSEALAKSRATLQDINTATAGRDNPEFYLIVVFPSADDRLAFTDSRKLPDARFISSKDFLDNIGPAPKLDT